MELRVAEEHGELGSHGTEHVLGHDLRRPAVLAMLAPGAQPLHERRSQPGLVRPTLRRGHRVAVAVQEAVRALKPSDGPLDPPGVARQLRLTRPGLGDGPRRAAHVLIEAVPQAPWEVQ